MGATSIQKVHAREILDSGGNPAVEVDVRLEGGALGRAAVPSGASTGEHEAWELRDGAKKRYGGNGKLASVCSVDQMIGAARGRHASLENANKQKLAPIAVLDLSLANAHACAAANGMSLFRYLGGNAAKVLPFPMMNILNGGAHSDAPIDFQEFMIMPKGAPTFAEALRYG